MKNDIIPPKLPRPVATPAPDTTPAQAGPTLSPTTGPVLPDVAAQTPPAQSSEPERSEPVKTRGTSRMSFKFLVLGFLVVLLLAVASVGIWFAMALRPVDPNDTSRERINVQPGSSLSSIGSLLEQKRIIRSSLAFTIYARLSDAGASLQAGTYSLSRSESSPTIISHFTSGKADQFSITFFPGATLRRLPGEKSERRTDVESVLLKSGYSQEEIDAAFAKSYDHPLFADKPIGADLEGYVYGETYTFNDSASVEQILNETFDEYYQAIEKHNLVEGFKAQGLNLYQGITLASIIQREVTSSADQKQVAQVFLTRLERGEMLGSDVTYQYAAQKLGVPQTPALNSPYNTRKVAGLPPGPIASPGLGSLQAVAAPAPGDYLFFLSGDDDVTYFARTSREHEANIVAHCREKCSEF